MKNALPKTYTQNTNSRNKYFSTKLITCDGKFDSIGEYNYWKQLLLEKLAGEIINIERQVVFEFIVNGEKIGKFILDFLVTFKNGVKEGRDFKNAYLVTGKGKSSPPAMLFKMKVKLVKALYNIEVKTVIHERAKNRKGKSSGFEIK